MTSQKWQMENEKKQMTNRINKMKHEYSWNNENCYF